MSLIGHRIKLFFLDMAIERMQHRYAIPLVLVLIHTNGWPIKNEGSLYFLNISVNFHSFNPIFFWTNRRSILYRNGYFH